MTASDLDLDLIDFDMRTPGRLARTLRDRRRHLGLTQIETARRAEVSPQWLSGFENGKASCGTHRMMRLLAALDMSIAVHSRPVTIADSILASTSVLPRS